MRATLALILMPSTAVAAPCSWVETDVPPVRLRGGVVIVQRPYQCPHDARGELTLEIRAIRAGAKASIEGCAGNFSISVHSAGVSIAMFFRRVEFQPPTNAPATGLPVFPSTTRPV